MKRWEITWLPAPPPTTKSSVWSAVLMAVMGSIFFGLPALAEALDVDILLDRHAKARGGVERWQAVQSLEIRGHYTAYSVRQPFRLWRQKPGFYRFEAIILDRETTYAAGPAGPWWIEPIFGLDWARRPIAPFDDLLARRARFEPLLLRARDEGLEIESLGEIDVDGVPTLGIQVTLESGAIENWYLDPETYLEHAVDSVTHDYTQTLAPIEQRSWFSDFREVDGLVLPHQFEQEYLARHTLLTIEEVEVDKALDPSLFVMPVNAGMERLRPLAGNWRVRVETRRSEQEPWTEQEILSTIEPQLDAALLVENIRWNVDGDHLEASRQYTFDRFRETFRMSSVDNVTYHMNVFEGFENEGRIELSNEETKTGWQLGEMQFRDRVTLYDLKADAFKIDWQQSRDGGKTWQLLTRFTYQRMQE